MRVPALFHGRGWAALIVGLFIVEVQVATSVDLSKVAVALNGNNVTASFVVDPAKRTLRGVVSGLVVGENALVATGSAVHGGAKPRAALTITNHPRGGPVLLGSQTT